MTYEAARVRIVKTSLALIFLYGSFFILAPATKFPLSFDQAVILIQMIFPLFLGYLATAVVFISKRQNNDAGAPITPLMEVLVHWPFVVATALSVATLASFGMSNWPSASDQVTSGMSYDVLSTLLSLILGIHTAITSGLVAYLFKQEP